MMDYKEMAEIVTKEVDAIIEKKKLRAIRIKKLSLAISGLCAAVIVCAGVLHFSSSMKMPDDSFNGSDIISESKTYATNAVPVTTTTALNDVIIESQTPVTKEKTTDIITTSIYPTIKTTVSTIQTTIRGTQRVRTTSTTTSGKSSTSITSFTQTIAVSTATTQKITSTMPNTGEVTTVTTTALVTDMPPNSSAEELFYGTTTTYEVTTIIPDISSTTSYGSGEKTTIYVIGFEDIDKEEIDKTVASKRTEYEESLQGTGKAPKEIEKLVTDYQKKIRLDMIKNAYKDKAMEILEELGVDPETAYFDNFAPNVRCPLTDKQYEKALSSGKVIRISIMQTG